MGVESMRKGKFHLVTSYLNGRPENGLVSRWLKFVERQGDLVVVEDQTGNQFNLKAADVVRVSTGRFDRGR